MTTSVSRGGLAVAGVSKRYGSMTILDEVDFHVAEGEFVAVVGPSGSGKTTLLNTVAGFVDPDEGEILVNGAAVTGPGPSRCVVFQEYAIFPWLTVRRNIEFGMRLKARRRPAAQRDEVVDRYLELMGLTAFADALPKTLSGGMRQRVALARAYAVDPEILLMDEPFAALDAQTRETMQETLLEINQKEKRTVLFVTHQVEEAIFLAERVVVMSARPARVREVVPVPWQGRRTHELKTTVEFIELRREIETMLRGSA
ncbi:ABC transporter ATP-binding protein [Streptosporangium soli]|nr:ABC transporter ATP-binding protein [Streptosporangium sp. KLBMP 9127]